MRSAASDVDEQTAAGHRHGEPLIPGGRRQNHLQPLAQADALVLLVGKALGQHEYDLVDESESGGRQP